MTMRERQRHRTQWARATVMVYSLSHFDQHGRVTREHDEDLARMVNRMSNNVHAVSVPLTKAMIVEASAALRDRVTQHNAAVNYFYGWKP